MTRPHGRRAQVFAERLAGGFPRSRFAGFDCSPEGIAAARAEAERPGRADARFALVDAARLSERAASDLVTTFDAVHDQADAAAVLRGVRRAPRPGGVHLMQENAGSRLAHENRS